MLEVSIQAFNARPCFISILGRKCTMSFWKSSFIHKTCSWALQLFSSDHTRPITQEKFISSLPITQPMLVLHLGTILSLFFKIKQPSHNSITQKSFVQNLSNLFIIDTQNLSNKTHAYPSLKTHKNSELHLILRLLHILTRNPKIKNYSCVSWPFASKSF